MASRKLRLRKRFLDSMGDAVELDDNPGPRVPTPHRFTRKNRKNSGKYYPRFLGGNPRWALMNGMEREYYDSWKNDYIYYKKEFVLDRSRLKKAALIKKYDFLPDEEFEILIRNNYKLRKLLAIRRARKSR